MLFLRPPRPDIASVAIFCGAFHPPTVAHVLLAQLARTKADEVLWILPKQFPHKLYEGVSLPARARMLLEATRDPVAISENSLFFSIAEETQEALPSSRIHVLAGEDGAQRIVEWPYPEIIDKQRYLQSNFERFPILSARRANAWEIPHPYAKHVQWLDIPEENHGISSSEVRRRIAAREDWRPLVPLSIRESVERFYGSVASASGQ